MRSLSRRVPLTRLASLADLSPQAGRGNSLHCYFFSCGENFAGTISEVCWSISRPDSDNFFT